MILDYLINVMVKICCLRPTGLKLHINSELVILGYATVCLFPSVALKNKKNCRKITILNISNGAQLQLL